jgi:tetraacyldisaccharide 4'-kinase
MRLWESRTAGFLLWPGSIAYGFVVGIRNWLFDHGYLRSHRLDAKVVGIGNITVGGTGKTPFVQMTAEWFSQKGISTAVLSRGYGGKGKGERIVSDGKCLQTNVRLAGDEPVLLAKRLPGVPVLVSPNRVASGRVAMQRFKSRVLILDDAFQHRRIKRDINVVLLNAERPFGNGRLLPAGPLREPLSSLKRADAVVLTDAEGSYLKADIKSIKTDIKSISRWTEAPVWRAVYRPQNWILHGTDKTASLGRLKGQRVLAFAGIGNPSSFVKSIQKTGTVVSRCLRFSDHYVYTGKDIHRIEKLAERLDVMAVVTTEKDGVRIVSWKGRIPLYCLRIRMDMVQGQSALKRMLFQSRRS